MHRRQYNVAHALYVLDNEGLKHTLRMCKAYCFSTTTVVGRITCIGVTFVSTYTKRSFALIREFLKLIYIYFMCGRDSSVGIATGYGLDGPGIESRWE
jgi:hypothetical protein